MHQLGVSSAMADLHHKIQIAAATTAEKSTVARMLQLYLHDFSEFARIDEPFGEIEHNGIFPYQHFDSYWNDAGREALIIRVDDRIGG